MALDTSHALVGGAALVGGTNVQSDITTLLTGFHGMDAAHAASASDLMVYCLGILAAVAVWWINRNTTSTQTPAPSSSLIIPETH